MQGKWEIWVIDEPTDDWFLEYATDDLLAADIVADWCRGVDLPYLMIELGTN